MDIADLIKRAEDELKSLDALEASVAQVRAKMACLRLLRQLIADRDIGDKVKALEKRFEKKTVGKFSFLEEQQDAKK